MDQIYYEENEQPNELKRHKKKTKKNNAWWKTVLTAVLLLAVFCGGALGGYVVSSMYIAPKVEEPNVEDDPLAGSMERMKGSYNILAVGRDKVALNTDTIMLVHIDTENDILNIMSIPRDTMSNVKRYVKKINAAYGVGGKANIDQLKSEISALLGVKVDRYVVVNLDAFEDVINAIGGVTIDVPENMKYRDPYQDLTINISKGPQTLNGAQAVGFVRFRSGYANGDLGRIEAQQLFIQALINQLTSPSIVNKIPELANIVKTNMDTDMTVQEIIWFAKQGLEIDLATGVNMMLLPGEAHYAYTGSQWLSYYLPFEDEILAMVNQYFNPYDTPITAEMLDVVDLNKLTIKDYSGKLAEKVTKRNYVSGGNANSAPVVDNDDDIAQPEPEEPPSGEGSNDNNTDTSDHTAEPAEKDNTAEPAQPSDAQGNDQQPADQTENNSDTNVSAGDKVEIVTDDKGNIYEIDKETGKILNVTPAPDNSADTDSGTEPQE